MLRLREAIAAVVSLALAFSPVWGASSNSTSNSTALGTLVYADRAHVGAAVAIDQQRRRPLPLRQSQSKRSGNHIIRCPAAACTPAP